MMDRLNLGAAHGAALLLCFTLAACGGEGPRDHAPLPGGRTDMTPFEQCLRESAMRAMDWQMIEERCRQGADRQNGLLDAPSADTTPEGDAVPEADTQ